MKRLLGGCFALFGLCCVLPSVVGQTADPMPTVPPALQAEHPPDAGSSRAREFQGDDLGQVLRLLARQAKINLVVGETVKGSVSMRLESTTAMGALEVLVRQYKLVMTKDDKGVCYLNPPEAADGTLDLLAKPETAARLAAYLHNLYAALLKEGFTPDEALKIVVASGPGQTMTALGKGAQTVAPAK